MNRKICSPVGDRKVELGNADPIQICPCAPCIDALNDFLVDNNICPAE